jgi:translation initiation factor IF-2
MTDTKEHNPRISLARPGGRLELKKTVDSGMVRQSFSHGRSKAVAVEVKRKRGIKPGEARQAEAPVRAEPAARGDAATRPTLRARADGQPPARAAAEAGRAPARRPVVLKPLTDEEKTARVRALTDAKKAEEEARSRAEQNARRLAEDADRRKAEEEAAVKRQAEEETRKRTEEEARRKAEQAASRMLAREDEERRKREQVDEAPAPSAEPRVARERPAEAAAAARPAEAPRPRVKGKAAAKAEDRAEGRRTAGQRREGARGRLVLDSDSEVVERRGPSLAAIRRQRERRHQQIQDAGPQVREIVLPETITVSELANRMAVRGAEVVKQLMKMGVMATINQVIDADTAELVVGEFGHQPRRVSEADVEIGLEGIDDRAE